VFDRACAIPAGPNRSAFLAEQYPDLPHADFSGDVLAHTGNLHVHVWPSSLGWTDLGTPSRLIAWLGGSADRHDRPQMAVADLVAS